MMKAYASGGKGTATQRAIDRSLGIGRRNPQSRFYERTGTTTLGGNARTRGVPATVRPVRGR